MERPTFDPTQAISIERLGLEGDGLAGPVRAPFTLPGEVVRGVLDGGTLRVGEILAPSPDRTAPVCRHFGTCGGCALQHASDAFLANWKRDAVGRALAARGLSAELRSTLTSPPRSRRRATFAGHRTRKTVAIGFRARRSDAVIDVVECPLVRPELLAAKPVLTELTGLGAGRGGTIRLGVTSGPAGLDIDVGGAKPLEADLGARLAALAEASDLARLTWNGETAALRRPPFQRFGAAHVTPPPGAFLQATAEGEAALTGAARAAVGDARRIADLVAQAQARAFLIDRGESGGVRRLRLGRLGAAGDGDAGRADRPPAPARRAAEIDGNRLELLARRRRIGRAVS
ncbi:MAG: class I SAM-dependent RNA methyltransferase, partial [Amaricoccus sp.]|uniref:class I SAM-dependent RNA methyltransferase n=1 Tax=Amaricoccus sp. TaxID=1872485 RepID=UPI003315A1F1